MKFNKSNYASTLTRAVLASLTFAVGGIAQAATDTWAGTTSTDISVGSNYFGSPTIATGDTLAFGSVNGQGTNILTDTGVLSLGGITFNSGALAYTLGGASITLTGGVTNNSTALETINNALVLSAAQTFATNTGNITLGGNITGSGGGITTTGTGTLTLSGTDSYTGATTIDSGTLDVTGTISGSALAFNGDGTFIAASTSAMTVSGVTLTSGVGTLEDSSSGKVLTLGGITRSADGGMVDFGLTTGSITTTTANTTGTAILGPWAFFGTGTTLTYAVGATTAGTATNITSYTAGTTATSGSLANVTSATTNYNYSAAATLTANLSGNTLRYTGGATTTALGAFTLTLNGLMNTGTGLLTITNATGGSLTAGSSGELDIISDINGIAISGPITGTGSLVFGGPQGTTGTLTLSSSTNTYSGGTYVNSGTLTIGGAGRLGSGTYAGAVAVANGATFNDSSTAGQILSGVISGAGTLSDTGTGTLTISGVSNTFNGSTIIGVGSTISLTGTSGGLASSNVTFSGDGTLTASNNDTVNGITIDSGVLGTVNNTVTAKTFTLGNITRGAGGMVDFGTPAGTAVDTTTTINANGIIGPWAFVGSTTNLAYAVGSTAGGATTIAALTTANGGTAATANLANVTSPTGNFIYDAGTGATPNQTGALTANTLQFTGTGVTWTNTGGATLNGLMNSGSAALTESGGGTIEVGTAGGEFDIVTNAQTITLGSAIIDNTSASSLAVASVGGAGTVSLNGINTYSGNTYVDSGTLSIGGAGQLGSGSYAGAVAITNGATFNYNSSATQTLSGVISGAGALTVTGTGSLTLSNAANTFTGNTTVSTGTLVLANGSGFATTATNNFTVGAGGTLQLGNADAAMSVTAYSLIFTGSGSVLDGTGGAGSTITLINPNKGSNPGGAIQVGAGDTATIGAGVTINLAGGGGYVAGNGTKVGGTIDDYGTLELVGGQVSINTITLNLESGGQLKAAFLDYGNNGGVEGSSIINTYTGSSISATSNIELKSNSSNSTAELNIYGGTVTTPLLEGVGSAGDIGIYNIAGGILNVGGFSANTGGTQFYYFNGGTIQVNTSTASFMPAASATDAYIGGTSAANGGDAGSNAGLIINLEGHSITIGQALLTGVGVSGNPGNISGLTDGGLTVTGSGTLTLSNAGNTYNGGTTITGATLVSTLAGSLGDTSGDLTINGGGVLDIDNVAQQVGAVTLGVDSTSTGSTIQSTGGTNTLTTSGVNVYGTGNTIASSAIVVGDTTLNSGAALDLEGQITGTVAVGTGGATLSGGGTVSGNSTLTGTGVINFGSTGNITGTLGVTGGNWNGAGSVGGVVTSSSGDFNIGSGANLTATSGVNVTGGTLSSTDSTGTITGGLNYTSPSNSTFAGVIAGIGNALTMNSSGATLTLTGANTYGGGTTITTGTLDVTQGGTLGASAGSLTLNGGTLDIEGDAGTPVDLVGNVNVGALNGSGGTITNLGTSDGNDNSNLTVGNGNTSGSYAGSIMDGGEFISLTKVGTGTQVLSGNSQYALGTTILGGILSISSESNIGDFDGYFATNGFTGAPTDVTLGGGELLTTASTPITEDVELNSGTTNTLAATTGTTATYSGVVQDGNGSGALNVGDSNGNAGTVALTNANTYTGGTTVNAGALQISNGTTGSATGSGALTVASTGTIVGIGTSISSSFNISGNVIAGSGLASDTTGQTVIEGAAVLHNSSFANATLAFNLDSASRNSTTVNVGATGVDFGNTTLSLTLQGGNIVGANTPYVLIVGINSSSLAGVDGSQYGGITTDASGADGLLAGQYKITGGLNLSFQNVESIYGPNSFLFLNTVDGADDIEVEVIPEPSTWALMLGGLALLVFWQRRKNNS